MEMAGRGRRRRLGDSIEMREELIMKACELSMEAHKSISGDGYQCHRLPSSHSYTGSEVLLMFAFAGSWSASDWFGDGLNPFGETPINLDLFPCLRSIGTMDIALVNGAFARRFETLLNTTSLAIEVERAVEEGKRVVFVGHSSGGSMAILATLWFLNKYTRIGGKTAPRGLTFGSPLVGDRIFPHAIRRENWARHFLHFVTRNDIVPLIPLTPFSSIKKELQQVLDFLHSECADKSVLTLDYASKFLKTVMINASSVVSHAASNLMGCTNLLAQTFSSFLQLSPHRPFGTYVFCNVNDELVVVENPDAVLQLLFHFSKLSYGVEDGEAAYTRLNEHMVYEEVRKSIANMYNVIYLDQPEEGTRAQEMNWASNLVSLSRRTKQCLRAAEEVEKRKKKNQESINKDGIIEGLRKIQAYRTDCERRKLGYYDSFKLQNEEKDFKANVTRLELTGKWDVVVEKLKKYELPDEFEGQKEWIELGTHHRRLVEPLDVANYYRHGRNEYAGPYINNGRPTIYRFTQRWFEHDKKMSFVPMSESCFMGEVENIRILQKNTPFNDLERTVGLEKEVLKWDQAEALGKDVFLKRSTFAQWWNSLPEDHKSKSCIRGLFHLHKIKPI